MTPEELVAIGQQLRAVREQRGQTLEMVAQATKIRLKFLEGFEFGEIDPSLTELQVRGFLRNYATYLQLDLDAMLWAYRQANINNKTRTGIFRKATPTPTSPMPVISLRTNTDSQTPPRGVPRVDRPVMSQTGEMPAYESPSSGGRIFMGIAVLVAVVLGLAAFGMFIQSSGGDSDGSAATVAPMQIEGGATATSATAPLDPKGNVIVLSPTPMPTTPPASGIIVAPPTVNMTGADQVSIIIEATQRSFIRVAVDGVVQYEGILSPGSSVDFRGNESITLRTSNAAGLTVVVNNQALGALGGRGELYEETYTLEGIPMPAVILSPTPTTEQLEPIDESRPEPILPVIPDSALTAEAISTIEAQNELPTPLPTPAPIETSSQ